MKETQRGTEIKILDRAHALENLARHAGIFEKDNLQKTADDTVGDWLQEMILTKGSRFVLNTESTTMEDATAS